MRAMKLGERRRREHRHVAVYNDDVAGEVARDSGHAASCGVTGAALLGLRCEREARVRHGGPCEGFDLARLMAHDNRERTRAEARERAHRAREHRFATELVEDLGTLG